MTVIINTANIEVDIVRLDADIIDEHLRASTSVLHDILQEEKKPENEHAGHACEQCGKFYKTERTLLSHVLLKHPSDKEQVQCSICDKKYSSVLSLQKHERYMHRYKHRCKACYRTFATPEILVSHGEGCRNSASPCRVCDKMFNSKLALRNHMKYNHPGSDESWKEERKQCNMCRRTFTNSRSLANHMAAVHPAGATDCGSCGKTFNSVAAYRSHYLYKHSEGGARCLKCHKLFATNRSLCRHIAKVHGHNQPDYLCGLCKMHFYNSKDFIHHVMQDHED